MTLLGPLAITITGQDTAIETWAAVFFGILLVIIAIFLIRLAKRERFYEADRFGNRPQS
ncbi:MAG: hypothetical protein XU15_C0004G0114 [candidate division NC10 bacterium CSP1-5]|nr:MAG: hypothetical protein XU15_C0004G0114 [candidate division NC10 bacterium CSP1-5]